jgi:hypothetical protein
MAIAQFGHLPHAGKLRDAGFSRLATRVRDAGGAARFSLCLGQLLERRTTI